MHVKGLSWMGVKIEQARQELLQAGIELIGPLQTMPDGYAWQSFRSPNGSVYELTYDPEHL